MAKESEYFALLKELLQAINPDMSMRVNASSVTVDIDNLMLEIGLPFTVNEFTDAMEGLDEQIPVGGATEEDEGEYFEDDYSN